MTTTPQDDPAPAPAEVPDFTPLQTPVTPRKRSATVGAGTQNETPKTPISGPRKEPKPTLLTDFFLGRPSPQRLAAQRSRRREAEIVQEQMRAEMKKEMKEGAVRKVPPPNGVSARVSMWQKRNAEVLAASGGDPEIAPSEPSEIIINVDEGSVTEEDRIRIKFRKPPSKRQKSRLRKETTPSEEEKENNSAETEDGERTGGEDTPKTGKPTPKKRIVSDDHWMKKKRKSKSPPRMTGALRPAASSNSTKKHPSPGPIPIPKDFLKKTAQNTPVLSKIQEWAMKVEPLEERPKLKHHGVRSRHGDETEEAESISVDAETAAHETRSDRTGKTEKSDRRSWTVRSGDSVSGRSSIRVKTTRRADFDHDGIRVRSTRSRHGDDSRSEPGASGTRGKALSQIDKDASPEPAASSTKEPEDGSRVTSQPDHKSETSSKKTLDNDGIRVRPIRGRRGAGYDDGIRIKPSKEVKDSVKRAPSRPAPASRSRECLEKRTPSAKERKSPDDEDNIEFIEEPKSEAAVDSPIVEDGAQRRSSRHMERRRTLRPERRRAEKKPESPKVAELQNDESSFVPPSEAPSVPSTLLPKNLDDIPFGHSAFSELDLPLRGEARHMRRPKAQTQRSGSFKTSVPKVLKKVVEESKKIIHDTVDPQKAPENKPPSIEKWLDTTIDPFVEKSPEGPTHHRTEIQKEWVQESKERRRSSSEIRKKEQETSGTPTRKRSVSEQRRRETSPVRRPSARRTEHSPVRRASVQKDDTTPRASRRVSTRENRQPSPVRRAPTAHEADAPSPSRRQPAEQKRRPEPVLTESELSSDLSKSTESTEWTTSTESADDLTPKKSGSQEVAKSPSSAGLRRSRATRNTISSPLRVPAKKPWKEALKEAFRGESVTKNNLPVRYPSQEKRQYEIPVDDEYSDVTESTDLSRTDLSKPTEPRTSPPSAAHSPHSPRNREAREHLGEPEDDGDPSKRHPPTTGFHQLSTILSEGESQVTASDISSSYLSETTVTHATNSTLTESTTHSAVTDSTITKSTDVTRKKSQQSGLKRRLTKHSDLVSVLSLPEDPNVPPSRSRSIRSARNVNRSSSKLNKTTLRNLLREFREDESLYSRELKTLVDGVVPVLLKHVVQGNGKGGDDLFCNDETGKKAAAMAKSVVGMGVSLEKIRNAHMQAPFMDPRELLMWLDYAHPVYSTYLDVWRLGFQDLIVNLAPIAGIPDDQDSLVNAMPRNEQGDVVNGDGERVDVAHLLKRPVHRIKLMIRLIKGCQTHVGHEVDDLLNKYEALHDKARQRHKEETARITDEEACNTDTSRVRDLRTLGILGDSAIDQTRQVNAKDLFSLELLHSSGQRLTCQVELVFRDSQRVSSDKGDVLIRETGNKRNWLLFAPIPIAFLSARKGSSKSELVVMVRGTYKSYDWYELITLTTACREQIQDWLEILGTDPVPPSADDDQRSVVQAPPASPRGSVDVPLGEKSVILGPRSRRSNPSKPLAETPVSSPKTPSRYHRRQQSAPTPPVLADSNSPDRTPTQESYLRGREVDQKSPTRPRSRGSETTVASESTVLQENESYEDDEDDTPPPPPAHKTLPSQQKKSKIDPPVELAPARLRRHGSSPLKHEYQPSDVSSEEEEWDDEELTSESSLSTEAESETDSSEDELESEDASVVTPAISIRKPQPKPDDSQLGSHLGSELGTELGTELSESSLAPDNSASQAGIPKYAEEKDRPEYLIKTVAIISYWSNRHAQWKDATAEPCSIIVTPGLIEVYPLHSSRPTSKQKPGNDNESRPLIALDLTPLVMIRQSTVIDLEIRSPARSYSKLNKLDASIFRFRAPSSGDCAALYTAVHTSRMNNAKFKALEQEARFRSFGQQPRPRPGSNGDDASSSSRRRSWFGRKNSYRASRAPSTIYSQSQSTSMSSGISANSFLGRLTSAGRMSFDIARSSVDKQHGSPGGSMYTSSDSPRSPSISFAGSSRGRDGLPGMGNLRIRCHLQVTPTKWEDYGNCRLQITRPPPGMKQELRAWHGLEKRIIVTSIPKKKSILTMEGRPGSIRKEQDNDKEPLKVMLDVVLGSGCFSRLGSRGICLNVWEEGRGDGSDLERAPEFGMPGGKVTRWCFQCVNGTEANWIYGLVAQEVMMA
ncbi:hypothetical protein MKZ38_000698 [Zalerion maritima]|uniref:Uncharacterized protein n=1 Tax=Zalerion maritima TaxID=339359 RepID=A0AAD5WU97_9PEZI|nr:hypothetical protein MKZ38_000698 [Zalerion maritima]